MKVRYGRKAQRDLDSIYSYLNARSPNGALSVLTEIHSQIELLGDFPFMASPTSIPGIRSLSLPHYPYKVFHRVRGSTVFIVHVRHTSRRPWRVER